ncbi:MAG: DNA-binding protein [Lachnospiraceae bacterium]|jgi:predicted DNA-binding protein with PD1-like motif|nr:DNA-binding protein [Lachnospiraceae bacterium]
MEYKQMGNHYVMRVDPGEEILEKIGILCKKENIRVGSAVGLGASNRAVVGLFDTVNKVYKKKELTGPMEITSLVGNISTKDGETYLHFHVNLCDEEMRIQGGHMNACYVSATAEITVTKSEGTVERSMDEEIGLNLYRF